MERGSDHGNRGLGSALSVAIDCNALYTTEAGVARYIRGLLRGLREDCAGSVDIHELAWPVENLAYGQPARMLKTCYRDFVWRGWLAPRALRAIGPDVYHSTLGAYVRPPRSTEWVATLHDLACFRHPERFRRWQRISSVRRTFAATKAGRIICISQFTADEAMQLLGVPANQIEVIHNGCDFNCDSPSPVETAPDFTVPSEYILFVGSLEPGKNLRLLRQTYELARREGIALPPLLIVGARWIGVPGEGPPPEGWRYLGRQPDAVLVFLYRRAMALAFPSIYEGFGLPVAEAMALECPVVCGRVASLPEIGGDAPLYADLEPAEWRRALSELAENGPRRRECIAAGRYQARKFSWGRCAKETESVYRLVAGGIRFT